ncbi:major facilitator superfamily transporter [Zalerion maritima]|uniref:Major facilitator superfamily transporter n=1 Tax=Zalerion maritima TaxID=339359 RepID=A0AAD5WY77_9PEZI|nr:major facilitator superfamily transporter [Zalerion maritima]
MSKTEDPKKSSVPLFSGDETDGMYNAGSIVDLESSSAAPATEKASPSHQWDPSEIPDGGVDAWLLVLGAWCAAFCSFGWVNSIGIWQEYYQNGPLSSYSSSTIAWIPSLQVFFMMGMGPIIGRLFDTFGPRYIVFGGTFLHVFGLMMASISKTYYQILLSQGVCSAIGVAAVFQPAINCIPDFFDHKRGAAFGILTTGSSVGGVIFPIMVSRLIPKVGYGWTMRISAFLILGLLVIANLTIKKRTPIVPNKFSFQQMKKPFTEPVTVGVLSGMFLLTFGIWVPIDFITVEAIARGMDTDLAQYLVAILNAGSFFGRLGSGLVADKVGKFNVFIISCYLTAILILAMWTPTADGDGKTIAFAILFGFFSGTYISLIGGLVADISPPQELGLRMGLTFLMSSLPGLTTSPIAGAILDTSGGWDGLKVFGGVFCMAGTTCVVGSRVAKTGWKVRAKF